MARGDERAPLLLDRGTGETSASTSRAWRHAHGHSFVIGALILVGCVGTRAFRVTTSRGAEGVEGGRGRENAGDGGDGRPREGLGRTFRPRRAASTSGFDVIGDPVVGPDGARGASGALVRTAGKYVSNATMVHNMRDDVDQTKAGTPRGVHLTLLTACGNLGSVPFHTGAWTDVVGARIATKTMSNDFLFDRAQEMKQTRCGTYEADVTLYPGEEFGFYLYKIGDATDRNTVSDIGCLSRGGARCPGFATPSALKGLELCTKKTDQGDDVFYNREFDGEQTTYVYGSCDYGCASDRPLGCSDDDVTEDDAYHDSTYVRT